AAGAAEAEHLPVVDDLDLGEPHQQVGDPPRVALLAEESADDRPLRIVAATRERVVPAEPPPAWHPSGRLARRQGGCSTASGSSPQTSICACSGYCAMIHWCSASTA